MCLCFSWFSNTFCSCKYFFITSECPTGFKNIPGLTTCYAVILSSKTWYQARDNCASRHNSKLVSIENEEERLRIGEYILGKISVSLYIHTCRFYILTNKSQNLYSFNESFAMTHLFVIQTRAIKDIEVPSRVDGRRRYFARVDDFVSESLTIKWSEWLGQKLACGRITLCEVDMTKCIDAGRITTITMCYGARKYSHWTINMIL